MSTISICHKNLLAKGHVTLEDLLDRAKIVFPQQIHGASMVNYIITIYFVQFKKCTLPKKKISTSNY